MTRRIDVPLAWRLQSAMFGLFIGVVCVATGGCSPAQAQDPGELAGPQVDEGTFPCRQSLSANQNVLWYWHPDHNQDPTHEAVIVRVFDPNNGPLFERFTDAGSTPLYLEYNSKKDHGDGNASTNVGLTAFRQWVIDNSAAPKPVAVDLRVYKYTILDDSSSSAEVSTPPALFAPGIYKVYQETEANSVAWVWRPSPGVPAKRPRDREVWLKYKLVGNAAKADAANRYCIPGAKYVSAKYSCARVDDSDDTAWDLAGHKAEALDAFKSYVSHLSHYPGNPSGTPGHALEYQTDMDADDYRIELVTLP